MNHDASVDNNLDTAEACSFLLFAHACGLLDEGVEFLNSERAHNPKIPTIRFVEPVKNYDFQGKIVAIDSLIVIFNDDRVDPSLISEIKERFPSHLVVTQSFLENLLYSAYTAIEEIKERDKKRTQNSPVLPVAKHNFTH